MYKYNSNFGAGCPNWAVWADLRFGFVHSTDILQKNYDVFCDQETQLLHWWIARKKMFLPRHLMNDLKTYKILKLLILQNCPNYIFSEVCEQKTKYKQIALVLEIFYLLNSISKILLYIVVSPFNCISILLE